MSPQLENGSFSQPLGGSQRLEAIAGAEDHQAIRGRREGEKVDFILGDEHPFNVGIEPGKGFAGDADIVVGAGSQ
jgi:hypothetical protein